MGTPGLRFDKSSQSLNISPSDAANAAVRLLKLTAVPEVQPLDGGYSNANFLIQAGGNKWVLRVSCRGSEAAQRERTAMALAGAGGIPVPRLVARADYGGRPVAVLEYIPGVLLSDLLQTGNANNIPALRAAGTELARIHSIVPPPDSLGIPTEVKGVSRDAADPGLEFMLNALEGRAGERLGAGISGRPKHYVRDRWHIVGQADIAPVLVHSDYNPKNILVDPDGGRIAAILDWEFSLSAGALTDMGNFLRFPEDYPDGGAAFIEGYTRTGGVLREGWEEGAHLVDLISMCYFLNRPGHLPRTFATARSVIQRTLQRWGE